MTVPAWRVELGAAIQEARTAAGLSQEEVAAALGVRQSSISQWERAVTAPTTGHLLGLLRILGAVLVRLLLGNDSFAAAHQGASVEHTELDDGCGPSAASAIGTESQPAAPPGDPAPSAGHDADGAGPAPAGAPSQAHARGSGGPDFATSTTPGTRGASRVVPPQGQPLSGGSRARANLELDASRTARGGRLQARPPARLGGRWSMPG